MDDRTVTSDPVSDEAALRGLYQSPMELAILKQLDRLDGHCRNFLAHSPFAVIGSTAGPGHRRARRRRAGFRRVLDDNTIAIPDRPGNNRLDTMSNIVADAEVGLLFFIPGIDETLRINGTARLSQEPSLLAAAAVNGREPRLVILVTVREAFLHCGKALKRSKLWHEDYRVEKSSFPSSGRIIVEQTKPAHVTVEQADAVVEEGYLNKLYSDKIPGASPILARCTARLFLAMSALGPAATRKWHVAPKRVTTGNGAVFQRPITLAGGELVLYALPAFGRFTVPFFKIHFGFAFAILFGG